ncbi:cytochrome P450 [Hypoxylon trugodes]|uniref:cytochrome P450 n=1 Tax=Hypoxylon trugodes TaxID=326681 RepID=UPI00219A38EB|nr:cytochrome P450 [Hypoxylon trugodes]KAI1385750.1 cytochrome P450 [Hypoxylon trugodes]
MDVFVRFYGHWLGFTTTAVVVSLAIATIVSVRSYICLRHIPGPFAASLTNFVRRWWIQTGSVHQKHTDLHRRYGTVVRYGPNAVLISQPEAVEKIYGFKSRFPKSEFYNTIIPRVKGERIPDVFATRDEDLHRRMRRPVANLYSVTNLLSFEEHIDSTINFFFSRLDELFANQARDSNLSEWMQLFAFDVLSEVTFSRRLGFLEKGGDIENLMGNNWKFFQAVFPNTQTPWLDYLWRDNPLRPATSTKDPLVEFGSARIRERLALTEAERLEINQKDFLSCFMREKEKDQSLPVNAILTWTNSNIQAGADTTGILASVVIYYLLRNPSSLDTLIREIDDAAEAGRISKLVTWKETQTLPYLEACINEASRLHPPISSPLERIVPESGLEVDGYLIPAGTRVSMNPWAVHREPHLYGDDADIWRPERWLCDEDQKKDMYNALLTFGAGHRTCLGKNLSLFEVYKLIPSMLQRYNLKLVSPVDDWTVETKWFAMPSGFHVRITTR